MLSRVITRLEASNPRRLLWLAILFSVLSSSALTALFSLAYRGQVVFHSVTMSAIISLGVSFLVALILIGFLDAVRTAEQNAEEERTIIGNLLENSAVATFVINHAHTVVFWNKACEELTGYSAGDMIGTRDHWKPFYGGHRQTLADVVLDGNSADLPNLYERHAHSTLREQGLHAEGWYDNMNGKRRYLIFDAAPVHNKSGKLVVVIETLQDITAQKLLEESLATSEDRLRTIIATEPECVKLLARDGTVLEMNPAGLSMVEAERPSQVVGRSMMPSIHRKYHARMQALMESVFQGRSGSLEFEIVGLKGAHRWVETHASPLRDKQGEIYAMLAVTRDITEWKHSENKLVEQLRFLQLLMDTIPMPVFYKDVQGIYQGCNKAFTEFMGRSKEDIVGRSVYDLSPKELADKYYAMDSELFDRPGVQVYDYVMKRADGTSRDIIFNKATYMDSHGKVAGLLGVMQDITRRKRMEEIIQRNYDVQAAINWILNISLKNISLNDVLKQSLDLLLSISWLSFGARGAILLVEGDPEKLVMKAERGLSDYVKEKCAIVPFGTCLCGRAAVSGDVQFSDELDHRHEISSDDMASHGHYCVPIKQAQTVLGVINIYTKAGHQREQKEVEFLGAIASALAGIIQRKRIEEEREKLIRDLQTLLNTVSRSQKEWRDTFDSLSDMIAIVNKDYTILKVNKAFSAYYGLKPAEAINRKCFELIHGSDTPIPTCPHRTIMEGGRESITEMTDRKTGRTLQISTHPYISPDGEIIGLIHVMRDVTDMKDKEMRLIMSERLAALGQMASGIAHEINNPLASVAGCSEGLLLRLKKGQVDVKLFESYLNIIQEEVFRCKSITSAMLSFVRKTTYERRDIDINHALDKTLEVISFQGRLKELRIEKNYQDPSPSVRGNEGELRQVFLAIITNALDAMEDKGTLILETRTDADRVAIRIADTGPGIPDEVRSRIFDPFFTSKSEKGGTGLGLSIAHKIILNHHGSIDVASTAAAGAAFTVTLPCNER
ncbi:MAG TPA: PAS domain S-box protein [Nitrospirota bacterium]